MSEPAQSNKTVVILTALDVETRAVLRQLGEFADESVSGTAFFTGKFEGWDVAVAEVGAGNAGAAAIAVRAIEHYRPSVALFVGIAGGVKDVAIGDVVVATKVYAYESGKDQSGGFKPRPDLLRTAHDLEQRARALRQRDAWKRRLDPAIEHGSPRVFVAPIAAGEKVVASKRSAVTKLIREHYGDALAAEMEGRGFLEGVHISHPVQGCVVRAISDLLSGKASADGAGTQQRAADAASAVAFEILSGLWSGQGRSAVADPAGKFVESASTFSKGAYFQKGEALAQLGVPDLDQVSFLSTHAPAAYLRIIPARALERPIPLASLNKIASRVELLRNGGFGGFTCMNKYGVISYAPDGSYRGGPAPIRRATQLFPNGELWAFTDDLIIRERNGRPTWVPIPLVHALAFERAFYSALHRNIAVAIDLDLSFPCRIELGLIGLAGAHLAINQDDIRGPIQANDATVRLDLASADPTAINSVLLEFFNGVHDKTGYARPLGLHGFPPGPPAG
jgi:nucleoside phosphorylase